MYLKLKQSLISFAVFGIFGLINAGVSFAQPSMPFQIVSSSVQNKLALSFYSTTERHAADAYISNYELSIQNSFDVQNLMKLSDFKLTTYIEVRTIHGQKYWVNQAGLNCLGCGHWAFGPSSIAYVPRLTVELVNPLYILNHVHLKMDAVNCDQFQNVLLNLSTSELKQYGFYHVFLLKCSESNGAANIIAETVTLR